MVLESCRCPAQQLRKTRQIPTGVTDLAVPQIMHQQEEVMIEVLLMRAPLAKHLATEGVTHIG